MNMFVHEEFIELSNDRLITALTILSENHGVVVQHTMDGKTVERYVKYGEDFEYILGEKSIDDFDDGAYTTCEETLTNILGKFFDTFGTDDHINWYIVNNQNDDIRTILPKVLDDAIMSISDFKSIKELVDYVGDSLYSKKTIDWILTNRDLFESKPYSDNLVAFEYAITTFKDGKMIITGDVGDQFLSEDEVRRFDCPYTQVYIAMYVYWLMTASVDTL